MAGTLEQHWSITNLQTPRFKNKIWNGVLKQASVFISELRWHRPTTPKKPEHPHPQWCRHWWTVLEGRRAAQNTHMEHTAHMKYYYYCHLKCSGTSHVLPWFLKCSHGSLGLASQQSSFPSGSRSHVQTQQGHQAAKRELHQRGL